MIDNGDYLQLDLLVFGSGTYQTLTEFRDEPRGLVLEVPPSVAYVFAGE